MYELEALRLTAIHNVTGITRNIEAGLELVEFGPEAQALSRRAGAESVLPNWLERLGYPDIQRLDCPLCRPGSRARSRFGTGFKVMGVPITQGPHAQ